MKVISLVFLAVCVVLATADIEPRFPDGSMIDPRIINGEKAERGQVPYQVSLRTKILRRHFCSASIISRRFLLTSGNCVTGLIHSKAPLIVAVIAALNVHNDGDTVDIERIIRHDGYEERELGIIHNIALLKTADLIAFRKSVQPIALPKQNSDGDASVVVSGWGQTKYSEDEGSGIIFPQTKWPNTLRYAEGKTLSNEECNKRYAPSRSVRNDMICAAHEESVGMCYGDYGAPLVDLTDPENPVQVGIAAQTVGCLTSQPGIYTRVYSYLKWIELHLGGYPN